MPHPKKPSPQTRRDRSKLGRVEKEILGAVYHWQSFQIRILQLPNRSDGHNAFTRRYIAAGCSLQPPPTPAKRASFSRAVHKLIERELLVQIRPRDEERDNAFFLVFPFNPQSKTQPLNYRLTERGMIAAKAYAPK
jgi:hypothetical protein